MNRLPLDVLSLIPTFLPSQRDRFHAASVCRYWRRTFLQCGSIWSLLITDNSNECLQTLLNRAKGSCLDVVIGQYRAANARELLSPRIKQIRHLEFEQTYWEDIIAFSDSQSFPLLRTLKVAPGDEFPQEKTLLFQGVVDFSFHSERSDNLIHFTFEHLSTFEVLIDWANDTFPSDLLKFLGASPTLQEVKVEIFSGTIWSEPDAWGVVDLPNLKTLSLSVTRGLPLYNLAACIYCRQVKSATLNYIECNWEAAVMYPNPLRIPDREFWDAINWYTINDQIEPEEVTIEIHDDYHHNVTALITFLTSDEVTIKLGIRYLEQQGRVHSAERGEKVVYSFLSDTLEAVKTHPRSATVKRLQIKQEILTESLSDMSKEFAALFKHLGSLKQLSFHGYHTGLFGTPDDQEKFVEFPNTQELVVSVPCRVPQIEVWKNHITLLARLQHKRCAVFNMTLKTVDSPYWLWALSKDLKEWVRGSIVHPGFWIDPSLRDETVAGWVVGQ